MIALDAANNGSADSNVQLLSYFHTTTGADRFLWVAVVTDGGIISVLYSSVMMTQVGLIAASGFSLSLWALENPDAGSHSVRVNMTGLATIYSVCASYVGAAQTVDPSGSVENETDGGSTYDLTMSLTAVSWTVLAFLNTTASGTAGAGAVLRATNVGNGGLRLFDSGSAANGSHAMNVIGLGSPANALGVIGRMAAADGGLTLLLQ